MAACTFCGSKNIRPSGSSRLDAPGARLRRALTLRCLYRCLDCDALFEALVLGVLNGSKLRRRGSESRQQRESKQSDSSVDASVQRLADESDNSDSSSGLQRVTS